MVCQVEEWREGAPQVVVGCLWWRFFFGVVEYEVVKLEMESLDWGM